MFINIVYKNIITKLFCCIIAFSIMCQVFVIPVNIGYDNIADDSLSVQTDIFSAVFVVEKTISEFTCSVVGNIFGQTSKQKKESKTNNKKLPSNKNELSILSVFQVNKTLNLQTISSVLLNKLLINDFCFREYDVGFIENIKNFTIYFLEMLLESSSCSRYGDYYINNNFYGSFVINPA